MSRILDLGIIDAIEAWGAGAAPTPGARVKVGVVDSGIDQDHPCFDGKNFDYTYPSFTGNAGDRNFTNSKVVVAKVFNMRAKVKGYTAEAVDSHGTHVAGTIACELDTPAGDRRCCDSLRRVRCGTCRAAGQLQRLPR